MSVFLCISVVLTLQLWYGVVATEIHSTLRAKRLEGARLPVLSHGTHALR